MITLTNHQKKRRNEVKRHIDEFIQKGGKIEQLPGFEHKPAYKAVVNGIREEV